MQSKCKQATAAQATAAAKVFVPFSEELLAAAGSPLGELVPFQLDYQCIRLLDGTYEFVASEDATSTLQKMSLPNPTALGHAA